MNEKFKKLCEEISKSEELVKKLNEINEKYPEKADNAKALVALAKEVGIEITEAELLASEPSKPAYGELSDDELEQVSGGRISYNGGGNGYRTAKSDCFCVVGGGGKSDALQKTCACVLGGGGAMTSEGRAIFNVKNALVCPGVGMAADMYDEW